MDPSLINTSISSMKETVSPSAGPTRDGARAPPALAKLSQMTHLSLPLNKMHHRPPYTPEKMGAGGLRTPRREE